MKARIEPVRKVNGKKRNGSYAPDETRRALLEAALKLFEKYGYHATSVDQIVSEAGLTKGAFYHHFESKEDLLRLIHDDYLDANIMWANKVLDTQGSSREHLRRLIAGAVVDIERYRSNVAVFLQEGRFLTGERLTSVRQKRDKVADLYMSVIQRGIDNGEFAPDLNARIVSFAIIGMCAWVLRWYRPGHGLSADEIADHFARLVLTGLESTPVKV